MACHRRATFCFATLLSIVIMICLFFEIIPPGMIRYEESCYGMVFDCEKCPKRMRIGDYSSCARTETKFSEEEKPKFVGALTVASLACGFITAAILTAVITRVLLFCSHFKWERFLSPFVTVYRVVVVLSMLGNITAMLLWSAELPIGFSYSFSFYLGWTANGLLLIVFILLLLL
ncbi:hypothetical protein Aperf_G00000112847 [Anoplocephala perfoliata]